MTEPKTPADEIRVAAAQMRDAAETASPTEGRFLTAVAEMLDDAVRDTHVSYYGWTYALGAARAYVDGWRAL